MLSKDETDATGLLGGVPDGRRTYIIRASPVSFPLPFNLFLVLATIPEQEPDLPARFMVKASTPLQLTPSLTMRFQRDKAGMSFRLR